MNANSNSIISYSLRGEDLVIVFLIVIFSDVVQRIVKYKLDFADQISIFQQNKTFWMFNVVDKFFYIAFIIIIFIIRSLYVKNMCATNLVWIVLIMYIFFIIIFKNIRNALVHQLPFYSKWRTPNSLSDSNVSPKLKK